jgi:LuxR family maltose regulon positive regulatory protein
LETLDRANLFVVPLDEERQWYRYHHLFAELLRHRLETEGNYDIQNLHGLASRWFAGNDLPAEAVHHALAAADWETAAGLIVSQTESFLKRGEVATTLRWFRALPADHLRGDPRLSYAFSWPLILTEQFDSAERYLDRAEQAALATDDTDFQSQIALTRAHMARARGDYAQVTELSEKVLAVLPADDHQARSVATLDLGLAYWYRGCLASADQALSEAQRAGKAAGNEYQ